MPARHKPAARLPSAGRWIGDAPTAIVLAPPDRQGSVHTRANPVHEPPHRTAGGVAPTRPVSASAAVAHPPARAPQGRSAHTHRAGYAPRHHGHAWSRHCPGNRSTVRRIHHGSARANPVRLRSIAGRFQCHESPPDTTPGALAQPVAAGQDRAKAAAEHPANNSRRPQAAPANAPGRPATGHPSTATHPHPAATPWPAPPTTIGIRDNAAGATGLPAPAGFPAETGGHALPARSARRANVVGRCRAAPASAAPATGRQSPPTPRIARGPVPHPAQAAPPGWLPTDCTGHESIAHRSH